MIAANTTITTTRLATTGAKKSYSDAVLDGVPVQIVRETPERAGLVDQENSHLVYRLMSDRNLDLLVSDKLIDREGNEYRVHNVDVPYRLPAIGWRFTAILKKAE